MNDLDELNRRFNLRKYYHNNIEKFTGKLFKIVDPGEFGNGSRPIFWKKTGHEEVMRYTDRPPQEEKEHPVEPIWVKHGTIGMILGSDYWGTYRLIVLIGEQKYYICAEHVTVFGVLE